MSPTCWQVSTPITPSFRRLPARRRVPRRLDGVLRAYAPKRTARCPLSPVVPSPYGSVPLLGVVPDLPMLGESTLRDLEHALEGDLIAGHRYRPLHFGVNDAFLVTTGLRRFLRRAFQQRDRSWNRPLFVTHATRDDLLLGFLAHHQKKMAAQCGQIDGDNDWAGRDTCAILSASSVAFRPTILTHPPPTAHTPPCTTYSSPMRSPRPAGAMVLSIGASKSFPDLVDYPDDREPLSYLTKMAKDTDAPVLITQHGTVDALERIKKFTAKHTVDDFSREIVSSSSLTKVGSSCVLRSPWPSWPYLEEPQL